MAEKLTKFDFQKPSEITSTEKMPYPWTQWLDGDIWKLTAGEDFHTHPLMMERIIRTRATSRKARVRLRHQPLHTGNGDPFGIIIMQRTDLIGPNEAKKAEQQAKRQAKKANAEVEAQQLVAQINGNKAKPSKRAVKNAVVSKVPTVPSKRPVRRAPVLATAS
jgi:hypothetical protein